MTPMKKSPLVPRMQRILHQRVTQLRILPTELVPKAAEDDNIRPRVNRYASLFSLIHFHSYALYYAYVLLSTVWKELISQSVYDNMLWLFFPLCVFSSRKNNYPNSVTKFPVSYQCFTNIFISTCQFDEFAGLQLTCSGLLWNLVAL